MNYRRQALQFCLDPAVIVVVQIFDQFQFKVFHRSRQDLCAKLFAGSGELLTYLADLNEQAQKRLDTIMEQMKATEGVTEELKCTRQMEWVQRCNNIHNRAEEIVLYEMIYS